MNKKVIEILEFNKILEQISVFADGDTVKEKIMSLLPSTDYEDVIFSLNETDEAVTALVKFLDPPSCGIAGQNDIFKRSLNGGILLPSDLLSVSRLIRVIRQYIKYGKNFENFKILNKYTDNLIPYPSVEKNIEDAVLNDEELKDSASVNLFSIRKNIKLTNDKIKTLLNNYINSPDYTKYLQDTLITVRNGRYVIPVKSEYKSEIKGIVHDSSSSGATLFVEPASVVENNNKIRQLEAEEKAEIEKILQKLSADVSVIAESMIENIKQLTKLEIAFSKAKYSLKINGIKPMVNKDHIVELHKAFHPLLNTNTAVPIDIKLGEEFDTLVITGPNTGGKTVSLKTVGLLQLMVQSGIFIPASSNSKVSVFKKIYADIGDEQSIEQSLSTFSAHMTNIVKIIEHIDRNSLVLFDELGAGTDPAEGAALAIAILEKVKNVGAKTIATTHYSEIKMYALTNERIENGCCEFDLKTLRPTYKLIIGIPGKSNAFAISKKLGLKREIIEDAQKFLTTDNIRFEDVISELENQKQIIKNDINSAEILKNEAEKYNIKVKEDKNRIQKEKDRILNEAYRKAKEIIDDAKDTAEKSLAEIKEKRKKFNDEKALNDIKKIRNSLKSKAESNLSEIKEKKETVKGKKIKEVFPGMDVYISDTDTNGTILSMPDKKGMVSVQSGIIKITVPLKNLRAIENDSAKIAIEDYNRNYSNLSKTMTLSSEIDLRGLYTDEALIKTEKFLDDAVMSSLKNVTIVHGKGTGALKNAIHSMLKEHRYVKSFRLGNYGEGDTGVTVVELI